MGEDTTSSQIGARLRKAREESGMSQSDLAKALGFGSATAVWLIESGARRLKAEGLQKAAEALGRPMGYFLGVDEKAPDIKMALRADRDLTEKDRDAIMRFVEFAKSRHDKQ